MTLTNRLGRPMLAAMFVSGGADQLRNPDEKVDAAAKVVDELNERIDDSPLPDDNRDVVRINGAVQLVAGGLLAINRVPRLAATALAASLVPTTLAVHRFWEIEDEDARAQQRVHFFKNLAMLGGLVITMGDTGSQPSVGWRARRAARRTSSGLASTASGVRRSTAGAATGVAGTVGGLAASATAALPTASAAGPDLSGRAEDALDSAKGVWKSSAPARESLRSRAGAVAGEVTGRARSVDVDRHRKQMTKSARKLAESASELASTAAAKVPLPAR